MCAVGAVAHQDGAVAEVSLLPQGPQLLHQLAAVVRQLQHRCEGRPPRVCSAAKVDDGAYVYSGTLNTGHGAGTGSSEKVWCQVTCVPLTRRFKMLRANVTLPSGRR